ncbi:stage III sporulation protein AH [Calderihabitans maritimus]|uniref:Stage III sporulation protein AG n=1 Tax=Calderihabitans maritimus TaxID=1246530 RepID=A0A1Z5HXA8_9FIRM|nr:stage III sporulation protein AH [Calderihabitans maritimus]GAW94163.1 stage III sporulation protein AG [Calderihabitans maritimus]
MKNLPKAQLPAFGALAVLALVGLVLITAGNLTGTEPRPEPAGGKSSKESWVEPGINLLTAAEMRLEERLEQILSEIEGVGKVSVTILFKTGPEYKFAVNENSIKRTVQEEDQTGGTRVTTEVNEDGQLVLARAAELGGEKPVVVKEIKPEVQGVLIVAEGAENPYVREKLSRAVQTILDISPHQVSVLSRKKGR